MDFPPEDRFSRDDIGVAHITQVTHVRNKNSYIQGRSLNVIKVIFNTIRNSKFFPLREVPILKRDANEENLCLIE